MLFVAFAKLYFAELFHLVADCTNVGCDVIKKNVCVARKCLFTLSFVFRIGSHFLLRQS